MIAQSRFNAPIKHTHEVYKKIYVCLQLRQPKQQYFPVIDNLNISNCKSENTAIIIKLGGNSQEANMTDPSTCQKSLCTEQNTQMHTKINVSV